MAAQHLAAIKIQNLVRRFLYKKRRLERRLPGGTQHQANLRKRHLQQIKKGGLHPAGFGAKVSNVSELQHLTAT